MQIPRMAPLLTLLLAAGAARAQDMIGTDFFGNVYLVDSSTAGGSLFNSSGIQEMNAMARRSDGKLFMAGRGASGGSGPSTIYALDPLTGNGTPVTMVPIGGISGLAFGPLDVLYAANDSSVPGVGPKDLHVIDLATGSAPLIGPIGYSGVSALAYGKGQLWAWDNNNSATGNGVGLITIDVNTGLGTDVNPAIHAGASGGILTLTFSPSGVLYGCNDKLFVLDTSNGWWTSVGFGPAAFGLRGLEFLEPAGPSIYCTAKPSSCGTTPTISGPAASTSQSLAGPGSFDVTVGLVPSGFNPSILIYSTGGALATPINGPYGYLCIKPGTGFFRVLPPVQPSAGSGCDSTYVFDFGNYLATQMPDPFLKQPSLPRLVELQAWYRDPPSPNGANLSNAMTISVVP